MVYLFGVFGSTEVYVNEAIAFERPFDSARSLPELMLRSLTQGFLAILRHGLSKLQEWREISKQVESEDKHVKDALHPDVRRILGNRRLALV